AAVRLLADEGEGPRLELGGDPLQARPVEVAPAKVAGAPRRPEGGIRQPDPEAERLELLFRPQRLRREAGVREQAPEVVARVGEMRPGCGRDEARVDPAEDHTQTGSEDVWDSASRGRVAALAVSARTPAHSRAVWDGAARSPDEGAAGSRPSGHTPSRGHFAL